MNPGEQRGDNPAAMRTWYVPDGVDTGPSGHRNPDGRGPRKPYGGNPSGSRPAGGRGPGGAGPRPYGDNRGPRPQGGRGPGSGEGRPQRAPKPYGHPGNAPSFPSDHANPGGFNPYGDQRGPRGPRPGGGNRGPRGGGQHGGNR